MNGSVGILEHDTPPPVLIAEGSVILEVGTPNDQLDEDSGLTPPNKRYRWNPSQTSQDDIYVAHVKVLAGSGDLLYHLGNDGNELKPKRKRAIHVRVGTKDDLSEALDISTNRKGFVFTIPSGDVAKKHPTGPDLDPPFGGKRKRFRHTDGHGSEKKFKVLKITRDPETSGQPEDVLYGVVLNDLPEEGSELRVMVWWAGVNDPPGVRL